MKLSIEQLHQMRENWANEVRACQSHDINNAFAAEHVAICDELIAMRSTPPAPDDVKRYVLGWNAPERNPFLPPEPAMIAGNWSPDTTSYVLASDYDSLARQVAGLRALLNEVRELVPHEKGDLICRRCRIDEALAGDQP